MNKRGVFFIVLGVSIVVLTAVFFVGTASPGGDADDRAGSDDSGISGGNGIDDNQIPDDRTTDNDDFPVVALPPTTLETVMAWGYPGEPACDAYIEAADGRQIDVLKPEFYTVRGGGEFVFMTEDAFGCNGYSTSTTELVRSLSEEQFVTISSSFALDMDAFLRRDEQTGEHTAELVSFVVQEQFKGVEVDFEGLWRLDS